ncbi:MULTISPECIES: universal stress protein [Nocardiaceae]|uniref:universal stress protein n=1 Tax=Nocardiaceae TaxID=85025 RepID=UPI000522F326|nr:MULTISPECIES: universal stress protein [Rhodococcus]
MVKILAGVDGSPTARAAAGRAAELAVALDAELHLITAYGAFRREEVSESPAGEKIIISSDSEAAKTAHLTALELCRRHADLTVSSAPAEGSPSEALLKTARDIGADLIVVGNKRVQGPGRLLGSIARDVAAAASCDVYVAHTHSRPRS